MPEDSGDLWSVLSKAEPNVLLLAITAVVIVLILSLVFYLVYNKPRADKRKSNLLSSSTLPASISAAAVSAAKKKKRPKSKPSASKSKNIAPVDKMDDAPETEEEEEEEESASKTALAPAPVAAPVKAAPAPAKAAGKVKKTEEEKALDELIAAEEKKNKDRKKKAAKATTASNGTKAKDATPVALMDAHEDDSDDDVNHGLFLNAGKKSAAFGILQSGEGWAVVETRNKPKAPAPAAAPTPATPVKTSENEVPPLTSTAVVEEPVTVVEEEAASVTPVAPAAPPVPVVEIISYELSVEAKKLGMLIGVKGATRIAIQKLTDTNIQMPKTEKDNTGPVIVTVSGQAAGVAKAVHAMQEMLTKGYCTLLASEDFQESDVSVHPRYIQSIIGKSGAVIRALSNHTGVKITVPADVKTPGPDGVVSKVKVGLAGPKDKVALCRNLIKDITRYYHTPITHPETIHEELQIDEKYYSYIIGQKGSEIKHIQNSLKVSLHMPDKDTVNPNVVIVGEAAAVERAKAHIAKLMQKKDERDNPPPKVDEEDEERTAAAVAEKTGTETAAAVTSPIGANWGGKSPAAAPVEGDPTWNSLSSPPLQAGLTMDMSVFPPPVGTSVPTTAAPIGLPAAPAKVGDGKPWNTLGGAKNW